MIVRRLRAFLKKPLGTKLLLLEAFLFLGWARFLKLLPFSRVSPSLGTLQTETSWSCFTEDEVTLRRVSRAVRTMSRYTWWESKCLVMAIAAMKMLQRRGIDSTLYLGTAKDEEGRMIAHAWLRSGPYYLTGAEEMAAFTVVSRFGRFTNGRHSQRRPQNG
ncbi:lasso peptide biosynthesis B2 protein [Cohnella sp. REN36]|uniref:lasso peptide biosynthesis B2 protein n=1 Tax=Cohnella sp. REN36 TaxID=2887347 RepID=UPI001D14929E|nr:lasso peptide biosynthesis B2 protein [Cohnella sp. REN36]MCC3376008.1 lasso peptide biosynthesis B2 protein [Cohnella sp. REN36]